MICSESRFVRNDVDRKSGKLAASAGLVAWFGDITGFTTLSAIIVGGFALKHMTDNIDPGFRGGGRCLITSVTIKTSIALHMATSPKQQE